MPRRSSEIEIFSTSFLDLISCALAGVMILWVLAMDTDPGKPDDPGAKPTVFFNWEQIGAFHAAGVEIVFEPDSEKAGFKVGAPDGRDEARQLFGAGSANGETKLEPYDDGMTLRVDFRAPGDGDGWAGWARFSAEQVSEPFSVRIRGKRCEQSGMTHPIFLTWAESGAARAMAIYFQDRKKLDAAIGMDARNRDLVYAALGIDAGLEPGCEQYLRAAEFIVLVTDERSEFDVFREGRTTHFWRDFWARVDKNGRVTLEYPAAPESERQALLRALGLVQ